MAIPRLLQLRVRLYKSFFFILLFIINSPLILSQQKNSETTLASTQDYNSTNKLEQILEFCKNLSNSNEEIIVQANNGIQIAKIQNDTLHEAKLLYWKGVAENSIGNFEDAFENLNKASYFYQQINDSLNIINCLTVISEAFMLQSEYEKSKKYIEQAIELTNKIEHPLLEYSVKLTQANIYCSQRDYPKTLSLYNELIEFCHEHNIDSTYVLLNSGTVMHSTGQSDVGLDRLFKIRNSDAAKEDDLAYAYLELHIGFI